MNKFILRCSKCGFSATMTEWFECYQKCRDCQTPENVEVVYTNQYTSFSTMFMSNKQYGNMWTYFDFLPVHYGSNVVSFGEGGVPISRFHYLENYAKAIFGYDIQVYGQLYNLSSGTGSFKDLAASVVASALKENNKKTYVVASTGNLAYAYAKYLSHAGIDSYCFLPKNTPVYFHIEIENLKHALAIACNENYDTTKKMAHEQATKNNIPLSPGTFDPLRIEAKKTMVYDWFKASRISPFTHKMPTVYVQAVSGGTGPLGVYKGCQDLIRHGLIKTHPRLILVQCKDFAPMTDAWEKAERWGFPHGWEHAYPKYKNTRGSLSTLATGNPAAYPNLAKKVKHTGGRFLSIDEQVLPAIQEEILGIRGMYIGKAAAVAIQGFKEGLKNHSIKNNDIVMLNIGENDREYK